MTFFQKLGEAINQNHSRLCVGLDPDPALMPAGTRVADFNRSIIEATSNFVCAYKLNLAFYEALGDEGMGALKVSLKHIPSSIPVIGDGKRADIGNTSKAYAKSLYEIFRFDAATVSPYMGFDSLEPFFNYKDRGIFVLCRTSNPGASDFQDLECRQPEGSLPLYRVVAGKVAGWNRHGNLGLVVGATFPEELKVIRQEHPELPLLIPGVGTQGGEMALVVRYGVAVKGGAAIINSSRQVLYASKDADFAQAAAAAARALRDQINHYQQSALSS